MPALAMTKPSRCLTIIRFGRARTTCSDSDRINSTNRASLPVCAAKSRAAWEGATDARAILRPSALLTIFCAMANTSPGSGAKPAHAMAADSCAARSSPACTMGRSGSAKSCRPGFKRSGGAAVAAPAPHIAAKTAPDPARARGRPNGGTRARHNSRCVRHVLPDHWRQSNG